jgi:hypothetical protein
MGLTNYRETKVRKQDVIIAKNYLTEEELAPLNNLVEQYLIFAQGQAMRRIPMYMSNWIKKLDSFLQINDREILKHAGKSLMKWQKNLQRMNMKNFILNALAKNEMNYLISIKL